MNIREHNRLAWNRQVEKRTPYTVPTPPEAIDAARNGKWTIFLTPTKPVPRHWLPNLRGSRILCLASGGGRHGPILAAAGADVAVFDNSPRQLETDRFVAEREGFSVALVEGDMVDLEVFPAESFDVIVHPVSNVFVPDVKPVWREAFRVLRPTGVLVSGFMNPAHYIFDWTLADRTGQLEVRNSIPYSDFDLAWIRVKSGVTSQTESRSNSVTPSTIRSEGR